MPAYTCPRCGSTNNIGVVGPAPHVQVQCPACSWWFEPATYVTNAPHIPSSTVPPSRAAPRPKSPIEREHDSPTRARLRLQAHVDKYNDYLDRDRDILLIAIYDRLGR